MDSELLAEARRAQEHLIDAEHDAEVARADFHRAVRRLHLNGASLRELAGALGLSHQRVHQIVESAGGSRRWLRRHEPASQVRAGARTACTFCGRDKSQAQLLIAGPHVHICDSCVGQARSMIDSTRAADALFARVLLMPESDRPGREQQVRLACSFCGKQRHQVVGMATSSAPPPAGSAPAGRPAICTECLDLCDEILTEDFAGGQARSR